MTKTTKSRIPGAYLSAVEELARHIRRHGPVPCVRVCSAQGTQWSYWGATRYALSVNRDGLPSIRAEHRTLRERRSKRLALRDAQEIASAEGRFLTDIIGKLDNVESELVLQWIYDHNLTADVPYLDIGGNGGNG